MRRQRRFFILPPKDGHQGVVTAQPYLRLSSITDPPASLTGWGVSGSCSNCGPICCTLILMDETTETQPANEFVLRIEADGFVTKAEEGAS